jgi:uncharacterized protein
VNEPARHPYGLPPHVLERLNATFRRWPQIDRAVLYGSRAKGKFRTGSDIDLCLEADTMQIDDLLKLCGQIDDLLLPWKVDLALKHTIENADLVAHIERVGVSVYERG